MNKNLLFSTIFPHNQSKEFVPAAYAYIMSL